MDGDSSRNTALTPRVKLFLVVVVMVIALLFLWKIRTIVSPFLWALVAAYLLTPVVNFLSIQGRLPRVWAVVLIYASAGLALLAGSRYLYPKLVEDGTVFIEDIPRLEASLIALAGPRPLGIDIASVIHQMLTSGSGYTGTPNNAGHLIVNALETFVKLFLFLVTTFYLLIDAPQLRSSLRRVLPPGQREELLMLGRKINLTWQQYIRGELVLFVIMATISSLGLTILGVPGAVFLGLATGALELLPLVGPWSAGALAVAVAYLNGTNQFGWSQVAYAGVVALMYLVIRQAEDYLVVPNVIGRAVRLHPLVVLLAVASGGIIGGLLGLLIAVPMAASAKEIFIYLRAKLFDLPVKFEPIRTIGGGIIEVPVNEPYNGENPAPGGTRPAEL